MWKVNATTCSRIEHNEITNTYNRDFISRGTYLNTVNLFKLDCETSNCFAYVSHARISSWNQPVLNNEGKVTCSRKQRERLVGLELTTDRHPPITSQTRYIPAAPR